MRLLDKMFMILLLGFFIIVGSVSFFQYIVLKSNEVYKVDDKLKKEKSFVIEQMKAIQPQNDFRYNTNGITILRDSSFNTIIDTFYTFKEDNVSYRELASGININGSKFQITIKKEIEQLHGFIYGVLFIFIVSLVLMVVIYLIVRYLFYYNVLNPFFKTLNQLQNSDFQNYLVEFDENNKTKEFNDFNKELNRMSERIYNEYQSQKMFIENVNHELMTPVSVIRGKLELLIQASNLSEDDLKLLSEVFNSIDKITKINKSLILLSKIDNNQFEEVKEVSIKEVTQEVLGAFEDQIRSSNLTVRINQVDDIIVKANESLIFVLISNLIRNAIFHNIHDGFISILIDENSFEIENSGQKNKKMVENLFERFVSESKNESSVGLGLSIIRKICEMYDIEIQYHKTQNKHVFKLEF